MTKQYEVFTVHIHAIKGIAHLQQIQEWLATVQKIKPEGVDLDVSYDPDRLSQLLSFEEESAGKFISPKMLEKAIMTDNIHTQTKSVQSPNCYSPWAYNSYTW